MVNGIWYTYVLILGSLSWLCRCKEHSCPLSPGSELWSTLEVPDRDLASWSWFGYGQWSLIHPCSEFMLSILILKVQRTSMSFKSWFGAFEDAGGSWLGFGILILIWIWSLVFGTSIFRILALYLDFEGAKNIHVLSVWIYVFLGCWKFLTWMSILIMIWILPLVFDTPMFYLDTEGEKQGCIKGIIGAKKWRE